MIALFGGTFDPIHLGHVHLAQQAIRQYGFTKVFFVPARKNPLKTSEPSALPIHRLDMIRLAIQEAGDPRFVCLDWELVRPGPSYTVLTLERLIAVEKTEAALIMGNEVFQAIPRWHQPAKLLGLANLVVVMRQGGLGFDPSHVLESVGIRDGKASLQKSALEEGCVERILHSKGTRWVDRFNLKPLPFSATELRRTLSQMASDSTHPPTMPPGIGRSVWQYIKENRLYAVTN